MKPRNLAIVSLKLFVITFSLSILLLCSLSPAAVASDLPIEKDKSQAPASPLHDIERLGFIDQDGHAMTPQRLRGKIVVLNFVFSHCDTSCPVQTSELAEVERKIPASLRKKIYFVSVSVDPSRDTPAALREFATSNRADLRNWAFLTGTKAQFAKLAETYEIFAPGKPGSKTGFHTTDIRLFDGSGRFMQRYSGVPLDKARLSREMEQLAAMKTSSSS